MGTLLMVTLSSAPPGMGAVLTEENSPLPLTILVTSSARNLVARAFAAPLVWQLNSSCTGFGSGGFMYSEDATSLRPLSTYMVAQPDISMAANATAATVARRDLIMCSP